MADATLGGLASDSVSESGRDLACDEAAATGLPGLERELARPGRAMEDEAARWARLEVDRRLVEIFQADCYTGPRFTKACQGWMDYSWRTMIKWMNPTSGAESIFDRSARAGRPIPSHRRVTDWTLADRHEIATDAVIDGRALFTEYGLVRGRWNPRGGASLTTYFVGATLRSFRPVYDRWYAERGHRHAELHRVPGRDGPEDVLARIPTQPGADPGSTAVLHDECLRLLQGISDPKLREALVLRALGHTQREAAHVVGLSEKALERKTSRARARLAKITAEPTRREGEAR
ncbi:sigma factor-like helix-turn-helix DNA-binding protein [Streptomyces sp. NPDC046887]|uniref:sigma factor-like helix-turn-helix DNA-binding protein n=1 Tax=Streptomyces sp. NPDC046887 TaxID=3155472 RepID=UPI0034051604